MSGLEDAGTVSCDFVPCPSWHGERNLKPMSLLEMATERELTSDAAPRPRVVLGLDAASTAASMVEWAAQEAIARGAKLQIVTSSVASCSSASSVPSRSSASCTARRIPVLMEAVLATRERHPLLSIEETTVRLDTQHELIDTARSADLLIVGEPYLGISTRHLLGSTAGVAVRRSSCPVIALRGQQRQPLRRIAVGIDDSSMRGNELARRCAASTVIEPRRNGFSTMLWITAQAGDVP